MVSVVIPCYRCAGTIGRAVESVASQTLPAGELILVDDASGDGTGEVLARLAAGYPGSRVRLIQLDRNSGPAAARNAGWAAATFPHVAFLDADDAWHPRKLELQMEFLARHPETGICGHLVQRAEGYIPADLDPAAMHVKAISRLRLLLSNPLTPSSVVVQRDLPHRFDERRRHMEDHALWLRAVFSGIAIVHLGIVLAYRYKAPYGDGGLSMQLFAMERAELANYSDLYREGYLSTIACRALQAYSIAKFVRRLLVVSARRLAQRR